MLEQQRHLMKSVLDDTCLNRLRLEGGTVLARIRKEEACDNESYRYVWTNGMETCEEAYLTFRLTQDWIIFRDAVEKLSTLYNQVDEEVHKLVILSNKSQKELESRLQMQKFEEQTQQVTAKPNMHPDYRHLYFTFSILKCDSFWQDD